MVFGPKKKNVIYYTDFKNTLKLKLEENYRLPLLKEIELCSPQSLKIHLNKTIPHKPLQKIARRRSP